MENFYDALIDEELHLAEDVIRAKEKELLAAITPPPSIEEPAPLAEVPSSSGILEAPEGLPAEIPVASLSVVA